MPIPTNNILAMIYTARSIATTMSAIVMISIVGISIGRAQTTNISGVINRYAIPVLIDRCNSSIVVKNPAGFAAGDKILIIQMKGAEINTTNTSSFGDVTSLHNAGNYELATIDEVNGFTLVLQHRLVREYDLNGHVQVVRVPQYVNATVTSTLTAKPWDGTTGGVLAFIASGTVTLNADIDLVGKGFRGGVPYNNLFSSVFGNSDQYYAGNTSDGAPKGEGIAEVSASQFNGLGKMANAGGGGNSRAAGGGGGANAGTGGQGGYQPSYASADDIGGRGGVALVYSNTQGKIFLGGGGGSAGYEDEKHPVAGTAGGGIVLIRASAISGNGNVIDASGEANTGGDNNGSVIGGGGGGAGGVVLLDISTYSSTVTVNANGGKGSSTSDNLVLTCYGPGGGGGGGCIWISPGSIPANLTPYHDKGTAGIVQVGAPPPSCQGTTYGAAAGDDGLVVNSLQIPEGTVPR